MIRAFLLIAALAFIALSARATPPQILFTYLGEQHGVKLTLIRPDSSPHGCLLAVATTGMGSPKPSLGCW